MRKAVIQSAYGEEHVRLLELTRSRHESWAKKNKYEYFCFSEHHAKCKLNGRTSYWDKLYYIYDFLQQGYDRVVWLDNDCVVCDTNIPLDNIFLEFNNDDFLGVVKIMSRSSNPYYNVGVIAVLNNGIVLEFLNAVFDSRPIMNCIHEEKNFNKISQKPMWRRHISALSERWNNWSRSNDCENPIINGYHCKSFEEKEKSIRNDLIEINNKSIIQ